MSYEDWMSELRTLFDRLGGVWVGHADWLDEFTLQEAFANEITPQEMFDVETNHAKPEQASGRTH